MRELGDDFGERDEKSASETASELSGAREEIFLDDTPNSPSEQDDDLVPLQSVVDEEEEDDEGEETEQTREEMIDPESALLSLKRDFGRLFGEMIEDALASPGVTIEAIAREAKWSSDTLSRLRRGERLPKSMQEFQGWITALERLTRRPVNPEKLAEAQTKVTEAEELPQTLKGKYEALLVTHGRLSERVQSYARTISDLRAKNDSFHEQIRATVTVPAETADVQRFTFELLNRRHALRKLRAQLLQTQADLRKALQQQQLALQALARCAQELLDVVDEFLMYLDAVLDSATDGQDQS